MERGVHIFDRSVQAEADGEGGVDGVHRGLVDAAHALAQAGLIQGADLLEQDDAVPVETGAALRERDVRRELRLVEAAAMTVGLWRLPVSFCTISTGRMPPCSLPTTGLRSA